jgi:hypothetical protein
MRWEISPQIRPKAAGSRFRSGEERNTGDYEMIEIPATSIAEKEMGNIVVANLIILGVS